VAAWIFIERCTISDSLYQIDEKTGVTKYYTDLPFRHVMEKPEFKDAKHVFTIHLTYGRDK